MEPEGSLPPLQVTATCPYPEPAQSSPYPHIPLPKVYGPAHKIEIYSIQNLKYMTNFYRVFNYYYNYFVYVLT
jgi:hypothetical protein